MSAPCASVRVCLRAEAEDLASGLLWEAGTLGIELRSAGAQVELVASFAPRPGLLEELRAALRPLEPLEVEPCEVAEVDWVARVREGFSAFDAAGFHIVPAWDALATSAASGARRLVVDPGRAFGTGAHETTRLCLGLLAEHAAAGPLGRVADVGCGSGILAVAARKLGARVAVALDLDTEATHAARRHAELNGVALDVVQGDGGRALCVGAFDLVLANLMAPLLLERRHELAALGDHGALLLLSGLLVSDLPELRAAYASLGAVEERRDGEWAALRVRLP